MIIVEKGRYLIEMGGYGSSKDATPPDNYGDYNWPKDLRVVVPECENMISSRGESGIGM